MIKINNPAYILYYYTDITTMPEISLHIAKLAHNILQGLSPSTIIAEFSKPYIVANLSQGDLQ